MLRTPFFLWVGLRNFTKAGYERAKASWTEEERSPMDNGNLKNKNVVITGANQGIGYATALLLAKRDANVYMVCRNEERGKEAVEKIKCETNNNNIYLRVCDISSLESIKKFTREFLSSGMPIHALVNNAGVLLHGNQKSIDGYEINFATNTLGTYAITKALQPALQKAAPSRVIFVSSGGALTENLVVDDLQGEKMNPMDGTKQYARDKRRQIVIAEELAKEWSDKGIKAVSCHPGWTDTVGVQTSIPEFRQTFVNKLRNLEEGADGVTFLCIVDADKLENGGFYLDRRVQNKHLPLGGTQQTSEQAAALIKKLDRMCDSHSVCNP